MIEAERLLFAAALEDPANQRFVLLSDRFGLDQCASNMHFLNLFINCASRCNS